MNKKHQSQMKSFLGREEGQILMASSLAIFVILILLSFTLISLMVNERDESANYVVEAKARQIAETGLDLGIQQFRHTRVPPIFTNGPFSTGKYTVRFDTLRYETGAFLPRCNYVMIKSRGEIYDVERNIRVVLSSLPHAFLFALYSQNIDEHHDRKLDLKDSIVNGDVYYRGNVKSTVPVSGTVYTPPAFDADQGTVTHHPEPQPPFPYLNVDPFLALLEAIDGFPSDDERDDDDPADDDPDNFHLHNSSLNLSFFPDQTLYVSGHAHFHNSTVIGPGTIVVNKHVNIHRSTFSDSITVVSGGKIKIKGEKHNGDDDDAEDIELIVDNSGPGFSTEGSGWLQKTDSKDYGNNYVKNKTNKSTKKGIFETTITTAGNYTVFAWWVSDSKSTKKARYIIKQDGTVLADVTKDQRTKEGQFNELAMVSLSSGTVSVEVSNVSGKNKVVVADAIKFLGPPGGDDDGQRSLSILGSAVCFPTDGVILFSVKDIDIKQSTVYGLVIAMGKLTLNKSSFYGAGFTFGKKLKVHKSTVLGSVVAKHELDIKGSIISRGALPLLLSQDIGLEPYIIPGTWLEY